MFKIIVLFIFVPAFSYAQEFMRITFQQYYTHTRFDPDKEDAIKPIREIKFVGKPIYRVEKTLFPGNPYMSLRAVYKGKVGTDSITVTLTNKKINRADSTNGLFKGTMAYGCYDVWGQPEVYVSSIQIQLNHRIVINLPAITPILFDSVFPYSIYRFPDQDLFYLHISGGDSACGYYGFLLFNDKGKYSWYINSDTMTPNYRPVKNDILSTDGKIYQYIPRVGETTFDALTIVAGDMGAEVVGEHDSEEIGMKRKYFLKYWDAMKGKNLEICKSLDLSKGLLSDTIYGDVGIFEKKIIFAYIYEVSKDRENPLLYHVKGIDMLGKNVCLFTGTFLVRYLYVTTYAETRMMNITGDLIFNENPSQKSSGVFVGSWKLLIQDLPNNASMESLNQFSRSKVMNGIFYLYADKRNKKFFHWASSYATSPYYQNSIEAGWWKYWLNR